MASSATEFINQIKSGKFANAVNAKRAVGIWSRHGKWNSEKDKESALAFIAKHFPDEAGKSSTPKAARKPRTPKAAPAAAAAA